MNRKWYLLLSLLLVLGLITSCGGGKDELVPAPEKPVESQEEAQEKLEGVHVLKVGATMPFEASKEGVTLIYDHLTHLDEHFEPLPWVVTSWDINEDYTEYTLMLDDSIVFHDGTPLDMETVKWNIENQGAIAYAGYVYVLDHVEVAGDHEVVVRFQRPYINFLADMAKLRLLPIDGMNEEGKFVDFNGTGPFVYEGKDGEATRLSKNEHYWVKDYANDVDEIEWLSIPDDQTRKLALSSGQVDVLGLSEHYLSIPYATVDTLAREEGVEIVREPSDRYTSVTSFSVNWKQGIMSELNMRKALAYMVDREDMVEKLYFHVPSACGHMYNPRFADGPKDEAPYDYDPALAVKALEAAGVVVGDEQQPATFHGEPLVWRLLVSSSPNEGDMAVYVQELAKTYGIEVAINVQEWTNREELLGNGDYDIIIWQPWFAPLVDSMAYDGISDEYGQYGLGGGYNEEMKSAGMKLMEAESPEEAEAAVKEVWHIQYENYVTIPLFGDQRIFLHNGKFEGYQFNSNVFYIDLNGLSYEGD